jgi:carbon starvation protein CstA
MTEAEVKRSLNLIRYGGVVITVTVFVVLLAFALVVGNAIDPSLAGKTFNSLLPYIIGFTVLAAVLSIALFFGYRAYLMGRMKQTP